MVLIYTIPSHKILVYISYFPFLQDGHVEVAKLLLEHGAQVCCFGEQVYYNPHNLL